MQRRYFRGKSTPLRIAVIYAVVGGLWIVFSDRLAATLVRDPQALTVVQTAKGWFYVAATAWMLYALIRRDIARIEESERALAESEQNFRTIFEYAPAFIVAYDRNAVVVQANSAMERVTGFTKEQVIGRSMFDTFARPEDRGLAEEVIRRVFTGEAIENLEWHYIRADGSDLYLLTNTTPIFSSQGRVAMGLSLSVDITERKRAEAGDRELELSKRDFYRRTIMAATEGKLIITDKSEIEKMAGPPVATWRIQEGEDLAIVREGVADIVSRSDMPEDKVFDLVLAVGEATTNAYKHAGGGTGSLHKVPGGFLFVVSDNGPGIEALVLPELALVRGYTTADSLGMGYKAMLTICDRVYLATGPGGTTVATEMLIHPGEKVPEPERLPDTWVR